RRRPAAGRTRCAGPRSTRPTAPRPPPASPRPHRPAGPRTVRNGPGRRPRRRWRARGHPPASTTPASPSTPCAPPGTTGDTPPPRGTLRADRHQAPAGSYPSPQTVPASASVVPDSATTAHNLRAILAKRGFRRLLGVRVISQIADGWFQAALAGSLLFNPEKRTSALEVATGFAVLLLPYSAIGPYAGGVLDRWSRQSIIFVANVLRALFVLPTIAFIWYGAESPPFVALALMIIGLNRFFLAGLSAAIPHVVDDRRLVTANALSGTLGSIFF